MQFNLDNHILTEMAHVGTTKDNIDINIYGGEGNIPHFHFYHKQSERKGCIRIDVPEYFEHGVNTDKLTRKEIKNLIEWLESDKTALKKFGATISVYTYICILWNDNNPEYMIDDEQIMPDYTKLN